MKPQECAKKIQAKKPLMDFLRRGNSVVIIDEVSMMSSAEVDRMDESLRLAMDTDRPFGGLRIVFVGDFLQLEPVQKDEQMKKPFAFQAKAWATGKVRTMKLTKVVRQADEKFVSFLNNLRLGNVTSWMEHNLERLNKRAIPASGAVHLFTRNNDCDKHNQAEMAKLPGKTYVVTADDTKAKADGPKGKYLMEDWYRTEQEMRLKVGAQVIHLINDNNSGLMNGDIGTILRFVPETKEIVVFWDRLKFEKAHMKISDYRESNPNSQQFRMQYPFKPAWGITIHKSQGMTLDKAVCSVGGSFAAGQVYVALSRIRTLEGLYVRSYDIDTISASAECLAFYGEKGNLRGAAAEAVDQLKMGNK
jgi:ATP-dependent exoDNAse (exonuclease V) alpha subunit